MKKKQTFWRKLSNRYRLTIFNESTYEEVASLRMSRLRVFTILSVLAVVLVSLTIILIAFTGLREYIPGYPDASLRREITTNALQVDSLQMALEQRDRFFNSIRMILSDEEDASLSQDSIPSLQAGYDTISLGISESEAAFRSEMEERERFKLALTTPEAESDGFYHFFPPVAGGIITNRFNEHVRHYGIDLVTKPNTNVSAVLDGVVILSDWMINTGYVIQIQHSGDIISVYKHNSVLLKRQGDAVRVGEVIAVVGDTGEETTGPHLHFELWKAGKSLDPEKYIKFE